jgi:hypothetical protein
LQLKEKDFTFYMQRFADADSSKDGKIGLPEFEQALETKPGNEFVKELFEMFGACLRTKGAARAGGGGGLAQPLEVPSVHHSSRTQSVGSLARSFVHLPFRSCVLTRCVNHDKSCFPPLSPWVTLHVPVPHGTDQDNDGALRYAGFFLQKNAIFARDFIPQMIILPRQARDKHAHVLNKRVAFSCRVCVWAPLHQQQGR